MELVKKFAGKVVGFDTSPFIYFLEKNRKYSPFLKQLFRSAQSGDFLIVTSTITLLEVLVLPIQENAKNLVQQYCDILQGAKGIQLITVRSDVAIRAAEIRAKFNIRTPDAVQIAAASCSNAEYVVTNDKKLARVDVDGLEILVLDDILLR